VSLRRTAVAVLLAAVATATATPAYAGPVPVDRPLRLGFLGEVQYPTGLMFRDTEVGGLSGITYDAARERYYALSDDRSERDPARYYTLTIDLADGSLEQDDVRIVDVTILLGPDGTPFPPRSLDPEGIALSPRDTLVITSEGDASALIAPFVREFALDGHQLAELPVPEYYDPGAGGNRGVRTNLAFESAGFTVDGEALFTGTENALVQDGPAATASTPSPARLLRYDGTTYALRGEFGYLVEPIPVPPVPPDAVNGLVELLPLDRTRLIAMERAFSTGVGNSVRLYAVDLSDAADVEGRPSLRRGPPPGPPAQKRLLLDVADLGVIPDNIEGLTYGPLLPDGSRSVVLVSDNNFAAEQVTQFIALSL